MKIDFPPYAEAKEQVESDDKCQTVLAAVAEEPGSPVEIAERVAYRVKDVSYALGELQDVYAVSVRDHPDPQIKREYVVLPRGERILRE